MKEKENSQPLSLIPGLPDEIALDCLVRVPYRFHSGLKSVCRGWNDLLAHPSFYRQRRISGKGEEFICLVQALVPNTDAVADSYAGKEEKPRSRAHSPPVYGLTLYNARDATWQRMPPPPTLSAGIPTFCQCVAVGRSKLVLLGGWDPVTLNSVADVYVCDLTRGGGWRRGAPMSTARSFFACAAVGPTSVYVAGGHDNQKNALRSAEVYDVESDTWRALPPMAEERDECRGLACGACRFWVVSGYDTESQGRFSSAAECYDPVRGVWTQVDGVWPFPNASPVASFCWSGQQKNTEVTKVQPSYDSLHFPSLWFLDINHKSVREFHPTNKTWKIASSMPDFISSSPCVVLIGGDSSPSLHKMFVIGSDTSDGGQRRHQACVLDVSSRKWTRIDTPVDYSGFVYSASSLYL
ncbi:F-box/kelch-repeat protein At2g44130-like [Magnolia sinica]|uniref:F-box/kelch-repeat protein At2g44130-like n=1 Tax=Magnolia sinica TaxID=86752 RepID=UPI00265868E6|nr:F-box/kelch-repeat protein At2g44130-like [Magnolia sinica]